MENKIRFRASGVGALMVGGIDAVELAKRDELAKNGNANKLTPIMAKDLKRLQEAGIEFELGATAKSFVKSEWLRIKYNYDEPVVTNEMLKGHICEQDSIKLISEVHPVKAFRRKNTRQFINDYFKGCPDIVLKQLDTIEDVKSSWSLKTFFEVDSYPEMYYAQGQVYMDLTGAKKFKLYYCLNNTPIELLTGEDKKYYYRFGGADNNPHYLEAVEKLYRNHNYDHIPAQDRVKVFEFEYDPEYITELKRRVEYARVYFDSLRLN